MNSLTILIHGDAGTGKSWLADTAPGPRLLLDAELRSLYTPSSKIEWDPRTDFPELGPDDTAVVKVRSFQDLEIAYQRLVPGHPFNSIIIDSLTEIQDRLIDYVAGTNQLQLQDWGRVLRDLASYVRRFRDLRDHPTHPIWSLVVIAGSKDKNGKQRPMLQGQISDRVPFWFDVVGYLQPQIVEGQLHRNLVVQPYIGPFDAKDNTGVLSDVYGPVILDPNLTSMIKSLNTTNQEESNG